MERLACSLTIIFLFPWPVSFHSILDGMDKMYDINGKPVGMYLLNVCDNEFLNNFFSSGTACLKWKKRFLAGGFPIFLGRWSDQTFF